MLFSFCERYDGKFGHAELLQRLQRKFELLLPPVDDDKLWRRLFPFLHMTVSSEHDFFNGSKIVNALDRADRKLPKERRIRVSLFENHDDAIGLFPRKV